MSFIDDISLLLIGTFLGFVFAIVWDLLKEWRSDNKERERVLSGIFYELKANRETIDIKNTIPLMDDCWVLVKFSGKDKLFDSNLNDLFEDLYSKIRRNRIMLKLNPTGYIRDDIKSGLDQLIAILERFN